VEAIFREEDLPVGQEAFIRLNAELAQRWPVITKRKEPLPDASAWAGRKEKLELLER
jgi:ferredoxin